MKKHIGLIIIIIASFHMAHASVIPAAGVAVDTGISTGTTTQTETNLPPRPTRILPLNSLTPNRLSAAYKGALNNLNPADRAILKKAVEQHLEKIQTTISTFAATLSEHKAVLSQKFGDAKAEEIIHVRAKVGENFSNAVLLLNTIASRIESRLEKIKADGRDTSSIDPLFADAQAKITIAETDLATLEATATADTNVDGSLKTKAEALRRDIIAARAALVRVITAIRGSLGMPEPVVNEETKSTTDIQPAPINTNTSAEVEVTDNDDTANNTAANIDSNVSITSQ